ncbi:MAG: methionyl-tRNA formyltransferase [Bacteroidia bacterium]|nr:methionyl-tRNA formyltransferase [Bacteroidia bacterium]
MRIVFFGASELGFDCCNMLVQEGHHVVGILTLPSSFNIKYKDEVQSKEVKNVLFKDFNYFKQEHNIPVESVTGKMSEYVERVERWNPELIIVIGWYFMIPQKIMNLPSKGVVAIHASLLPKYRGNAPLVWAMINGEKETGVSFFYISDGVDEGDIIKQEKFEITEDDTILNVLKKTSQASLKVLKECVPLLAAGTSKRIKQDHSQATLFPKRSPEDGLIDWSWSPNKIKNFIRAQTKPYPGAFTIINGKKITIWDASIDPIN